MVWGPHRNVNFFILCGTVVCNFCVIHPQRGNTGGWGWTNSFLVFFTASIWQENSRVQCCKNRVLTFSSSRTRDCKLAFPWLPSPTGTLAFITQEFFPKPRLVIAVILPYDTLKMSLLWVSLRSGFGRLYSSKTSNMSHVTFKEKSPGVCLDHHRGGTGLKSSFRAMFQIHAFF